MPSDSEPGQGGFIAFSHLGHVTEEAVPQMALASYIHRWKNEAKTHSRDHLTSFTSLWFRRVAQEPHV